MIKIYVADLAKYNEGTLHGKWITLPNEHLWNEVQEMLGSNEEWAIHDYEAPFNISEYEDLDKLNTIAEKYQELDDQDIKKINYLIDNNGSTFDEAIEKYEDVDLYEDMSLEDMAYELVENGCFGEINPTIANYIDYEAIARDLSFDYTVIDNDIFRSA